MIFERTVDGRQQHRLRQYQPASPSESDVRIGVVVGLPAADGDLAGQQARLGLERDVTASGKVDHRRGELADRRSSRHEQRGTCRRQPGRRCRHEHGGVVGVDRVAPVPIPADGQETEQPEPHDGRHDETEHGVPDPRRLQLPDVVRGDLGIDRVQRCQEGCVEVALAQLGQHHAVEDGLALPFAQVCGTEARARLQANGAMLAIGLHVEEDDQAVVESFPSDTPLVTERLAVGGCDIVIGVRLRLRVDDHLGAGAGLDRLDQAGRLCLGRVREDARLVVDHDPRHGFRERRSGRQRRTGSDQQPTQGDGQQDRPTNAGPCSPRVPHGRTVNVPSAMSSAPQR